MLHGGQGPPQTPPTVPWAPLPCTFCGRCQENPFVKTLGDLRVCDRCLARRVAPQPAGAVLACSLCERRFGTRVAWWSREVIAPSLVGSTAVLCTGCHRTLRNMLASRDPG